MDLLTLILVAFTPGIFWLWFFARRSIYRPDPPRLLIMTFFLGMLATIPAGILNTVFLSDEVLEDRAGLVSVAIGMLLVVGPVEETCKFLAVWLGPRRSLYFDEPMDAFIYAAAASLGFASLENLLYVFSFGPEVMLVRAPLSTVGHVVFAGFWAFALASRFNGAPGRPAVAPSGGAGGGAPGTVVQYRTRRVHLLAGLAAAAIAHGLFNVFVFVQPLIAIAGVVLGLVFLLRRYEWARVTSPFRYRRNVPFRPCDNCNTLIRITSRYCRICGAPVSGHPRLLVCGNCRARNRGDASYCTRCGDRLVSRLR